MPLGALLEQTAWQINAWFLYQEKRLFTPLRNSRVSISLWYTSSPFKILTFLSMFRNKQWVRRRAYMQTVCLNIWFQSSLRGETPVRSKSISFHTFLTISHFWGVAVAPHKVDISKEIIRPSISTPQTEVGSTYKQVKLTFSVQKAPCGYSP